MGNKFDVIIIGAGPAGLKCAEQFKYSKISVLLIERKKIIGPKTCAGGLTDLCYRYDFPESKVRVFNKMMIFIRDKKYEVKLPFPLRTIDRYELGQHLLNKIKDSKNITILKETTVREIKRDRVITDKGEFFYKNLVGTDGSSSVVRRFLGLPSKLSVGMIYKIPQMVNDLKIYFHPKLLEAIYIWIFPHKDHTNIGIGLHPNSKKMDFRKTKEVLENFLKENNFTYFEKDFESATLNFCYKGCIFGNIFLAGDAAGLVSKFKGEGISYALTSGEEIGKRIINPDYKMPEINRVLRVKKKEERLGKIFENVPFLQEYFLKLYIKFFNKLSSS